LTPARVITYIRPLPLESDRKVATVKSKLKRVWGGWKRVASAIGRFQTRVLLTLFYFLVAGPAWLISRMVRKQLLDRRTGEGERYWKDYESTGEGIDRARHQF
jgi:hypothetical protein